MDAVQDFYEKYGLLSSMATSPEDVEQWLVMAIGQTNQCCGTIDPVNVAATRELGIFYRKTGRLQEARAYLDRAAELSEQRYGADSLECLSAQMHAAAATREAGDVLTAVDQLERARSACRSACGEESILGAGILRELALAYRDAGEVGSAIACARKSADVASRVDERPDEVATTLVLLANLLTASGDAGSACEALDQALALESEGRKLSADVRADVLEARGTVLFQAQEYEGARAAFAEELMVLQGADGGDGRSPRPGLVCLYLAVCRDRLGEHDQALLSARQGYGLLESTLGATHPMTMQAGQTLLQLQRGSK